MGERRALLDPEMYKISEEDSQDEEVLSAGALANYAEDALKLGEEATTITSWNNNVPPPVLPPEGWGNGTEDNNNRNNNFIPQPSSSFSSAIHRLSGVTNLKYSNLQGQSQNHLSLKSGNKFSLPVQELDGDGVDWPDTSTNSDSCLSSDDRRQNKRRPWMYGDDFDSAMSSSNKFISRTYFGEEVRKRGDGSSFTYLDEEEDNVPARTNHAPSIPGLPLPAHHEYTQSQRRHFPKKSRRRSITSMQHGPGHNHHQNYSESTSASDCSDESSDESPCTDCRRPTRSGLNPEREGEGQSESSSDAEDYEDESSYSESSFDEYDDAYDDDFENEYYEDIVKFLSDNEFEHSTNADGDLFLVEYSSEPETLDSSKSHKISVSSRELTPQIESDAEKERASYCRRNSSDSSIQPQSEAVTLSATASSEPCTSSSTVTHFQKSGKGAKGKISRLLKRRKDAPTKIQKETESLGANNTPASLQTQSTDGGNVPAQSSPKNSSPHSHNTSKSPLSSSALLSSIAKHKGRLSTKPNSDQSGNSQPEKVFRFKDEHGGETRAVFVDVPQSDGNGNLLGRRATLIESVLGIIPGRFSTPASNSIEPAELNADRIMVAGFVPDGVASRYRRIKIGDWLQSVDDIPVDHCNVDQVLSSRSMYGKRRTAFETEYLRLKLTLTRVAGCMVSLPTSKDDTNHQSVTILSHISTELKRSNVTPNVQSHVAILYISTISSSQGSSNGVNSENDANQNDGQSSTQHTNDSNEPPKPPEKSKDVVFCWPKETDSKIVKALVASQGMFSTLYRLLWDVTGSHPLVSRILIDDCGVDVTYTSDDQGKSLLLVAIATCLSTYNINYNQPNKSEAGNSNLCSPDGTSGVGDGKKKEKKIRWREPQGGNNNVTVSMRVLTRLENILKYQFGSLGNAFKHESIGKTSRLLINGISALNDLSEDFLFLQVPGNFLRFPNSIRSGIDDVLYSFETSDTVYCSPKNVSRRSIAGDMPVFHCHGSCLMYKGFLVTSHLENELASAFHGWWKTQLGLWEGVKRNSLMERWKAVSRLALWQQTSLPRKNAFPFTSENSEGSNATQRQSVSNTRAFSAMVGVGNFTLGFVLEHLTDGNGHVGPDPGWIRRAMATICRLYHSGLTRSFECWLDKQGERHEFVDLSGISPTSSKHSKHLNKNNSQQNQIKNSSVTQTLKKPGGTNSILKNADAVQLTSPTCPIHSIGAGSTTSSSSSGSSICSCPTAPSLSSPTSSTMKSYIGTSTLTLGPSGVRSGIAAQFQPSTSTSVPSGIDSLSPGVNDAGDSDGDETTTGSDSSSFKWYETTGAESSLDYSNGATGGELKSIRVTRANLLFDYIQIEFGRGVMLSSKDVHEGWASVIRHNFRQSVTVIHGILHKAAKARNRLEERGQDKKWVSKALAPISEHGILFNCQISEPRDLQKRKPRKREINYWVVGRIYPEEREVYVCYEDAPLSQNIVELAYKIALNVHC